MTCASSYNGVHPAVEASRGQKAVIDRLRAAVDAVYHYRKHLENCAEVGTDAKSSVDISITALNCIGGACPKPNTPVEKATFSLDLNNTTNCLGEAYKQCNGAPTCPGCWLECHGTVHPVSQTYWELETPTHSYISQKFAGLTCDTPERADPTWTATTKAPNPKGTFEVNVYIQ